MNGLYNIQLSLEEGRLVNNRVGLLHGRTGVPVFLLFLKGISSSETLSLYSAQDVENALYNCTENEDKRAWQCLLPFFESKGGFAKVVIQPLLKTTDLVTQMLGHDGGLRQRTGLFALKNLREQADLVVIPQASLSLEPEAHAHLHRALFALLKDLAHGFALVDLPQSFTIENAGHYLKNMESPDAAVFYPWVYHAGISLPSASLAASQLQRTDASLQMASSPANRPFETRWSPLFDLKPLAVQEGLASRLNIWKEFPPTGLRLWGDRTLADKLDFSNRNIPGRRTALALREAIESLCEPFLLEPLHVDLPEQVEVTLDSQFRKFESLFDPDAKQPFSITCRLAEESRQEVLEVNFRFRLATLVDELQLSMGFNA